MPVSAPVSAGNENKWTQYALYGCGCLLLVTICVLLAIAFLIILYPETLDGLTQTGFNTLILVQAQLNLGTYL